jgi:hypothetical protein
MMCGTVGAFTRSPPFGAINLLALSLRPKKWLLFRGGENDRQMLSRAREYRCIPGPKKEDFVRRAGLGG